MTPDQMTELLPILEAYARGEVIEWRWQRIDSDGNTPGDWRKLPDENLLLHGGFDFRIKPVPKQIPWTADDVPPVCWLRHGALDFNTHHMVVRTGQEGIILVNVGHIRWAILASHWHYSTDRKTWKPCTKEG